MHSGLTDSIFRSFSFGAFFCVCVFFKIWNFKKLFYDTKIQKMNRLWDALCKQELSTKFISSYLNRTFPIILHSCIRFRFYFHFHSKSFKKWFRNRRWKKFPSNKNWWLAYVNIKFISLFDLNAKRPEAINDSDDS